MLVKLLPLLLGLIAGWAAISFTKDDKKTVYVFPTPYSAGQVEYRDRAGICYIYDSQSTTCPSSPDIIPLQ